jgi:hypothetical protein
VAIAILYLNEGSPQIGRCAGSIICAADSSETFAEITEMRDAMIASALKREK